jgi:hypothetical protein
MSAGPSRAYGLGTPRIAVGATANLVLLDPNAMWQVTEGGFRSRSANSWLLGKTLKGKVLATWRTGAWCTKRERLPRARGRHGLRRRVGRRSRVRVRRGGVHDVDDRLPGDRHRPELCRAVDLLHRADGRQLRRRAGALRVEAATCTRRVDARSTRACVDGLAARARHRRALGIDTRSLVLKLRDGGSMRARGRSPGDGVSVDEALRGGSRAAGR